MTTGGHGLHLSQVNAAPWSSESFTSSQSQTRRMIHFGGYQR